MMALPAKQRENIARTLALRSRATPARRESLPGTVAAVHVASGRCRLRGRPQKSSRVSIASQARSWQNPPRARIVPASRLPVSTDARPPAQGAEYPPGLCEIPPRVARVLSMERVEGLCFAKTSQTISQPCLAGSGRERDSGNRSTARARLRSGGEAAASLSPILRFVRGQEARKKSAVQACHLQNRFWSSAQEAQRKGCEIQR